MRARELERVPSRVRELDLELETLPLKLTEIAAGSRRVDGS